MSPYATRVPALILAAVPIVLVASVGHGAAMPSTPQAATPKQPVVTRYAAEPTSSSPAARRKGKPTTAWPRGVVPTRKNPYPAFSPQPGQRPWWNRPSGVQGAEWVYPSFPEACYQADTRAGGVNASAWQVLWAYPEGRASQLRPFLRGLRRSLRGAQSLFAASAGRYIRDQDELFSRSLAPRFVTTGRCKIDVVPVAVPASVYNGGYDDGSSGVVPFGEGSITEWLEQHGYAAPNRKYLVFLQSSPTYDHLWSGISEDLASDPEAGAAAETPTLDNPANYTSFSYVDAEWALARRMDPAWTADAAQLIAHEMTHALGAMTEDAPHENAANPAHPSDCWDLLCYGAGTKGETYSNGCGTKTKRNLVVLARGQMRLDCNRDDYWAPATDDGLTAATWTTQRWAVNSSSFLYGNPQPTAAQLAAHQR